MTLQDIEIPQSSCVGKFLSAPVISHVSEISNNQIDDEVVLKNFKLGSLEHDVSPSDLSKLEQLIVNHKSAFSHLACITKSNTVSMTSLIKACRDEPPHH